MMVMPYMNGERFARWYAERHVARRCGSLAVTQTRDRPDISDAVNAVYARFATTGVDVRLSMGEAAFTCGEGSAARQGYYLAGTLLTRAAYGGIWAVDRLAGYVAAPDQVPLAQAVLTHMVATYRLNPEWEAMQQNVAAGTSRIVAQTSAEISRLIGETYWNRQATLDDVSRKWSNAMLGQTDVVDPATGERWKVASGSNYYWRRAGSDAVVGTSTSDRPDIDFAPLREW
ncbi:MAG TPA: hypothetical protein VHG28_04045 [Longimicrobiaceae bacterium]|nr:hypothetical protein [Longimicrobiaceae bacterium]